MPRTSKSTSTETPAKTSRTKATTRSSTKASTKATTRATSTKSKTPRTPKAPVLKKAEIEAMLLSAQKKLHDAEVTLEAQTGELENLRTRVAEQDKDLTETRERYYDGRVDVTLAQHALNKAQAAARTATSETRHLTQLLAQAERDAAEARSAQAKLAQEASSKIDRGELEAALKQINDLKAELAHTKATARTADDSLKEINNLKAQLQAAKKDATDAAALRKRVAEQDQRLDTNRREIADLTALLNESETRQASAGQGLEEAVAYGRAAVGVLISPPDTMRLDQERMNRAAQALAASDVFDPEWYLNENGDVAESGADASLHFLEFGFAEGRKPRPAK